VANLQFSSELLDDMLRRAGETTSGNSKYEARSLIYLNRAYRSLAQGGLEFDNKKVRDWWWLYTQGNVILQPIRTTGTVAVTQNNATATLSAVVASDLDGYFFKVDGHQDVFKVSAHTAGAAVLTLDSVYTGDTNATATYTLFKLDYDLAADFARLMTPFRRHQSSADEVYSLDVREFQNQNPLSLMQTGVPDRFAFVDHNTVRFNAKGDADGDYIRLDYFYIKTITDLTDSASEEPAVPLQYRHVLADLGLYFLLLDKESGKTEAILAQAKSGLRAMQTEQDSRAPKMGFPGRIYPRGKQGRYGRQLQTSSGWARFN
jgi:hypothetical protein